MSNLLKLPRGIRNNNPGNIKDFGIEWDGLQPEPSRPIELQDEKTFCVFTHPWYGIRVMVKQIQRNRWTHGCISLREQIKRWAPGEDGNPVVSYLNHVSGRTGFPADGRFPVDNAPVMEKLIRAMIEFENGHDPYTWEVKVGFALAGLQPSYRREDYGKPE